LVNVPLLGLTIDFHWPPDLVAEVDGAASHLTRRAFQDDRDRDSLLVSSGYRVLRFTWWDVVHRPAVVVQRIRRALRAHSLPRTSIRRLEER
jgi:very-short-patch-repair endonuclease